MRMIIVPSLLLLANGYSQSPVLGPDDYPTPTLSATYVQSDDAFNIASGADHTWYLGYLDTYPGWQMLYAEPSQLPGHEEFPLSDLAFFNTAAPERVIFSRNDADGASILGYYYTSTTEAFHYTDPYTYLVYPCQMGTAWTDTMIQVTGNGTTSTSITDFGVTGYGTLHLPTGTAYDVLLVEDEYVETDTLGGDISIYSFLTQSFYAPGHPVALAMFYTDTQIYNGVVEFQGHFSNILSGLTIGQPEIANGIALEIWPIPASTVLSVSTEAGELPTLEILDLAGRMVRSIPRSPHRLRDISVEDLAPGPYLLTARWEGGRATTKRFIVR